MKDPVVPISWGDLFDRISILEIKHSRMTAETARASVRGQLAVMNDAAKTLQSAPAELSGLKAALKTVNERLWDVEDELRILERRQQFDARFVFLAREVYRNNDERGRVKRAIDHLLGSAMTEHKQYPDYAKGDKPAR